VPLGAIVIDPLSSDAPTVEALQELDQILSNPSKDHAPHPEHLAEIATLFSDRPDAAAEVRMLAAQIAFDIGDNPAGITHLDTAALHWIDRGNPESLRTTLLLASGMRPMTDDEHAYRFGRLLTTALIDGHRARVADCITGPRDDPRLRDRARMLPKRETSLLMRVAQWMNVSPISSDVARVLYRAMLEQLAHSPRLFDGQVGLHVALGPNADEAGVQIDDHAGLLCLPRLTVVLESAVSDLPYPSYAGKVLRAIRENCLETVSLPEHDQSDFMLIIRAQLGVARMNGNSVAELRLLDRLDAMSALTTGDVSRYLSLLADAGRYEDAQKVYQRVQDDVDERAKQFGAKIERAYNAQAARRRVIGFRTAAERMRPVPYATSSSISPI